MVREWALAERRAGRGSMTTGLMTRARPNNVSVIGPSF